MIGITHALTGVTLAGTILGASPSTIAVSAIASLVPDIDCPESTIGRKIPIIPSLMNIFCGHRTLTHSLAGLLAGFFIFRLFNPELALAWALGFGSHLLLDTLTPMGTMLFWPVPLHIRVGLVDTGGVIDWSCAIGLLIFNLSTEWGQAMWSKIGSQVLSSICHLVQFV